MFVPFIVVVPGMIAAVTVAELVQLKEDGSGGATYNDSMLFLMRDLLPNGMLGVAIAGLLASFMAGMAANISAFNTVFSYDLWQTYLVKDKNDSYYTRVGRVATVAATVVAIGTATFAASYSNIMTYLQTLFGFFNAPLFATFILGMFWKRMPAAAGWSGLVAGTAAAITVWVLSEDVLGVIGIGEQGGAFVAAGAAFVVDIIVSVVVSLWTEPKTESELEGLVYSRARRARAREDYSRLPWHQQPARLAGVALGMVVVLNILFW